MPDPIPASRFAELFINDTPLLDVRAPVEFRRGAFPCASNLPLLDDSQRHEVGIRYRQAGQEAAIALGHELVSGPVREERLAAWLDFARSHPDALLYCFRGGLRSRVVQDWLAAEGVDMPRVAGGYKALRQFLLQRIESAGEDASLIILAGKTGSAKTHLLQQLPAALDLEGCANHRGSAFGPRPGGQPVQIDFENCIAIALLKTLARQPRHLFVEDESRAIGSLSVPLPFFTAMKEAPLAVIEETLDARVQTILDDYIFANFEAMQAHTARDAFPAFRAYLLSSLDKIQRRLGGERYSDIRRLMESALRRQEETGERQEHRLWIERLLRDYYDPMYDYQLNKKLTRIVFRGDRSEFLDWAATLDRPLMA